MPIGTRSRGELKQYFVKNAIPTESNFVDLINGMLNQKEDGIAKPLNEALSIEAVGDNTSQKKVLQFYNSFSDTSPTWVFSLNPRQDTANAGLSIGDSAGNSRLYIEQRTGHVGVGTLGPRAALHVDRGATNNLALMLSSSGPGWGSGLQFENTAAGNAKTFGIYAGFGALHFADVNASTDRMLITKDGNVGIGTTTPRGRLDVPTGDAWVGRLLHISAESDGTDAGVLDIHNTTNRKFWRITQRAGEADKLIFFRNDATSNPWFPVLKLGMDGLVEAPGSMSIGGKLTVAGGVQAKLHVIGNAGVLDIEGTDHAYIQWYPMRATAGRKGWIGYGGVNTTTMTINNDAGELHLSGQGVRIYGDLEIENSVGLGWARGAADFNAPLRSGLYEYPQPAGSPPDRSHGSGWWHLIAVRHSNRGNHHQLQIASSYSENDRLFFRKIARDLNDGGRPAWNEVATVTNGILKVGDWTIESAGDHLFIKKGSSVVARFSTTWDRFLVFKDLNNAAPYFYYNKDGNYGR